MKPVIDIKYPGRKTIIAAGAPPRRKISVVSYRESGAAPKKVKVSDVAVVRDKFEFLKKFKKKEAAKRRKSPVFTKRKIILPLLIVSAAFLAGSVLVLSFAKSGLAAAFGTAAANFKEAAASFSGFDSRKSLEILNGNSRQIETINEIAGAYGLKTLTSFGGAFWPKLKAVPEILNDLSEVNGAALEIAEGTERLKRDGFSLLTGGGGEEIIGTVENLNRNLGRLGEALKNLRNRSAVFDESSLFAADYLKSAAVVYEAEGFTGALLNFLKSYTDRHLLVFFQNPSEIRPGGGFIGGYAHLTVNRGNITDIDVRDIYDPDGQLDLKVIPPRQLQSLTTAWGARDANWFFDFSDSAEKIIEFLEASKMYSERLVKFDGALAVNIGIIEDLLSITGPVDLPEYGLKLSADNFLLEVEKEVRIGRDKRAGEPKKILKVLAPVLLERFKNLAEADRAAFIRALADRAKNKDVMVYFKDPKIQNFARKAGLAGDVYEWPAGVVGDYLAVVNANVAGGKSDAFVKQSVEFASVIDVGGTVFNEVSVIRTHEGQNEKYSWWRADNQNFVKIFAAGNVKLTAVSGGTPKAVFPRLDYRKNGYRGDRDLLKIESASVYDDELDAEIFKEKDKAAFGVWFTVPAGESKNLTVSYSHLNKIAFSDGASYQFVYDKQSGVDSGLNIKIQAPPGFIFKESGSPVFERRAANTERRVIVNLTFKKVL